MPDAAQPLIYPELDPPEDFISAGTIRTDFPGDRDRARDQFRRTKAIHFSNILAPDFLKIILQHAAVVPYLTLKDRDPAVEASPQRISRLLDVAFQRAAMLRWMEDVTGCEPLHTFGGRLTQTEAANESHRGWHDDLVESDKRRLALVINFSPTPYVGGDFELRVKDGPAVFHHRYQQVNEAILFLVDPTLQHRVKTVTAGGPRRVFAGWALVK